MRILFKHANTGPIAVVAPVIATLGLLGIIRSFVGLTWGGEFRTIEAPASTDGYTVGGTTIPFSALNALIILTVSIILIGLAILFQRTNLGLALRASAFAPEIAKLAGIRTARIRTIGWAIAGGVGGVAGMLVTSNNFLSPYSLDLLLVFGFIAAVIGGLESMVGAVIGALVLGIGLTFILNYVGTSLVFIGGFTVLILVLSISPKFGAVLSAIPGGVLGGVQVALFGMIGLLGAKIWIESKVNFADSTNLLVAASAVIIGIADISWTSGDFTFNGIINATLVAVIGYRLFHTISKARGTNAA